MNTLLPGNRLLLAGYQTYRQAVGNSTRRRSRVQRGQVDLRVSLHLVAEVIIWTDCLNARTVAKTHVSLDTYCDDDTTHSDCMQLLGPGLCPGTGAWDILPVSVAWMEAD